MGQKVLLVYGGGSIKRNGLYAQVQSILSELGADVTELGGVEPNPRLTSVQKGIRLSQEKWRSVYFGSWGAAVCSTVRKRLQRV
ncbi:hypothetical protein GCM10020331_071890 [Ectobacillus funiculus]